MAASGTQTIQLYYSTTSGTAPVAGNLASGELAINITDGKLYYKDNGGTVQTLATKDATSGSFSSITVSGTATFSGGTANGVLYLNGSKVATSGSALTFDGTNFSVVNGNIDSGFAKNISLNATNSSDVDRLQWKYGGTAYAWIERINSTGDMAFTVQQSEGMRLTSTGLGIGTSSPAYKLDVVSASDAPLLEIKSTATANNTAMRLGIDGNNSFINASGGSTGVLQFRTYGTTQATLDASGNLGIGTSSPARQLDVNKTAIFDSNGTGTTTVPSVAIGSSGVGFSYIGSQQLAFITNSAERMRLDSSGRLLVGTTSASGSNYLQVNSDALISGLTVGKGAGSVSTNTAVGASALAANTTGGWNTAVGQNALASNSTSNNNAAFGQSSLNKTTGGDNTGVGANSLGNNTSGQYNTAIGSSALIFNSTASNNTAVGYQAGYSNTTGAQNNFFGRQTGFNITTGSYNLFVGEQTGYYQQTASNNTAVGAYAFNGSSTPANNTGAYNVAIGGSALNSNSSGGNNTALGYQALQANTTASNNTAVGYQAGYAITTGERNAILGTQALVGGTTASYNTVMGYAAYSGSSATGNHVTALGYGALSNNTSGSYNIAVGSNALNANTTASNNTAVGYQALYNNNRTADTNSSNTAIGYQAGYPITTGNANVMLGYGTGTTLTTGGNNIHVGINSTASSASVSNELIINTASGVTGKGANTGFISPNGGGVYQGNNSASWSTTSDQRIKENITPVASGLGVITQLNPVTFDYILTKKSDVGFIAQEFEKVLPDQVQTHAASPEEKELTGSDTLYGITPNLVPYLVAAIKELKSELDSVKAELATLKGN